MKQIINRVILLLPVVFFTACGGSSDSKQEKQEANAATTTTEDVPEHDINEPFLYPFGLEVNTYEPTGYRSGCGGDCCFSVKTFEKGEYVLFADTSDCWEYGYTERYLLFRGDKLIASHEKDFDMGKFYSSFNMRNRMERTVDYENEKVFIRRDTVRNSEKKWINKEFTEGRFSSELSDEVMAYIEDPRKRKSYSEENDFSVLRSGESGEANPIYFYGRLAMDEEVVVTEEAYALHEIEPSNFQSRGIPKNAVYAFSTWWAGGGALYYMKINDGVLQFYETWEEEQYSESTAFELYFELDPDINVGKPDHYIVFNPEKGAQNKLMIAMDEKETALYAKYEGQSRQIALRKKSDTVDGKKIITVYEEYLHGIPNGTYTHTHDGIWDYITYSGKNGKQVKYTINHKLTSPGDSGEYRKRPLF